MVDSILTAADITGVRYFNFADNATDPEVLGDFSKMLSQTDAGLRWTTSTRLDKTVTLERCLGFRKAGCTNLFLGIETLNPRLLKLTEKGTRVETIQKVLSNAAWAGIFVCGYMMVGFPTETVEEARESFEKVKQLGREGLISKYLYTPLFLVPGSKYYETPEKYGIRNVRIPPHQDLDGLLFDFEADGMTRREAWQLATEFSVPDKVVLPMWVEIGGKPHPVKQDLAGIVREVGGELSLVI